MYREKIFISFLVLLIAPTALESAIDCTKLRKGQFLCPDPDSNYHYIDKKTQSVKGCQKDGNAIGNLPYS